MQETQFQPQSQQTSILSHEAKGSQNKIHVSVRMKPITSEEMNQDKNRYWQVINDNMITQCQTKEVYSFDKVYNDERSTADIFDQEAKKLVLSALEGYNVTIFAYGQTASGKTFTMRGTDDNLGIIPLALTEIFAKLNDQYGKPFSFKDHHQVCNVQKTWNVKVSYLEIYNECVNDLLDASKKNLDVRESRQKGIYIDGLSEFEVTSLADTLSYLLKGDEQRAIAETKLNQKSSRSHTMFRIDIMVREKNFETGKILIRTSQINLVDLAGSEGVNKTKSEGVRFREGTNINKSLLALSTVICKLGQKYQQTAKNYFINFRDSKLTRILQQPLSGNSQTAIICTMSQLVNNYQESRETLNFGAKAKNIKTFVNVNEIIKESPEELALRIQILLKENDDLRKKLKIQDEFEKVLEDNKEEFTNLGYIKSHYDFLNKLIDVKNEQLIQLEKQQVITVLNIYRNFTLQDRNDELTLKMEQAEYNNRQAQTKYEEIMIFNMENLHHNEQLIQQKHGLESKIQQLEHQLSTLQFQQKRYSLDNTMNNVYKIKYQSKLDISTTSILSHDHKRESININEDMQQDVLYLMSENEKLKSTIKFIQETKEDLDLQQNQSQQLIQNQRDQLLTEQNNHIRLMQNYRTLRLDFKKKDKQLTKKNFQIQGLFEKIELLQKSNTCLFKELDQTIQGVSVIHNSSQLEMVEDYLNGDQIEQQADKPHQTQSAFLSSSLKSQIMELSTKCEILQNEKRNLKTQVEVMQTDLEEADKNIYMLTMSIKNMDVDIAQVVDENEDLEEEFHKITEKYRNEIDEQRDCIEDLEEQVQKLKDKDIAKTQEIESLKTEMIEKDRKIIDIEELNKNLKSKKRSRQEQEQNYQLSTTDVIKNLQYKVQVGEQKENKRFKPNIVDDYIGGDHNITGKTQDVECKFIQLINIVVVQEISKNKTLFSQITDKLFFFNQKSKVQSKDHTDKSKINQQMIQDKENLNVINTNKVQNTSQEIIRNMNKNFKSQINLSKSNANDSQKRMQTNPFLSQWRV